MSKDVMQGIALMAIAGAMVVVPLSLSPSLPPTYEPETVSPPVSTTPTTYETDSLPLPSATEHATEPVALVHDPSTNTSIVYPDTLPPCDDEDGTPVSNGKIVAACKWDATSTGNGEGDSFIVIHP